MTLLEELQPCTLVRGTSMDCSAVKSAVRWSNEAPLEYACEDLPCPMPGVFLHRVGLMNASNEVQGKIEMLETLQRNRRMQ